MSLGCLTQEARVAAPPPELDFRLVDEGHRCAARRARWYDEEMTERERAHDDRPTVTTQHVRVPSDARFVIVVTSPVESFVVPFVDDAATLVLGRSPECDIRLAHPSVSRRHARLSLGKYCSVEDLRSRNQTIVGEIALEAGGRTELRPGAVVRLGEATVEIRCARGASEGRTRGGVLPADPVKRFVSGHPAIQAVFDTVARVAATDIPVLILGETGVGKEVVAEAIHIQSARAKGSYVKVNCAAIPSELFESQLFGVERGAFTGASNGTPGFLEAASDGTLLLDEIGDMPLAMQAKLLRVIETGELTRIGSVRPRRIDVRFVCSTNCDVEGLVAAGRFRADLFYRVSGVTVRVPALRERPEDILPLAEFFLACATRQTGSEQVRFSPTACSALLGSAWRGNVRELKNVVQRAVALCGRGEIFPEHLGISHAERPTRRPGDPLACTLQLPRATEVAGVESTGGGRKEGAPPEFRNRLRAFEHDQIVAALTKTGGNRTRAARLLGIARRTLITKIERLGIDMPPPSRETLPDDEND